MGKIPITEMKMIFSPNDSPLMAIIRAARECAIRDYPNGDTCGVCHKHFDECEEDKMTHDDEVPMDDKKMFFACPGARMRLALARKKESKKNRKKRRKARPLNDTM